MARILETKGLGKTLVKSNVFRNDIELESGQLTVLGEGLTGSANLFL